MSLTQRIPINSVDRKVHMKLLWPYNSVLHLHPPEADYVDRRRRDPSQEQVKGGTGLHLARLNLWLLRQRRSLMKFN